MSDFDAEAAYDGHGGSHHPTFHKSLPAGVNAYGLKFEPFDPVVAYGKPAAPQYAAYQSSNNMHQQQQPAHSNSNDNNEPPATSQMTYDDSPSPHADANASPSCCEVMCFFCSCCLHALGDDQSSKK